MRIRLAQLTAFASLSVFRLQQEKDAGVNVTHQIYSGVTHEFSGMGAVVTSAKDAEDFASSRLKQSLTK